MTSNLTPIQRVFATLGHSEPDRVPLLLGAGMHYAQVKGIPFKEYFTTPRHIVDSQLWLGETLRNDLVSAFMYAPAEFEAWGGQVMFHDDGPPNSGEPLIKNFNDILSLEPPRVGGSPCLTKMLDATLMLKKAAGENYPLVGVVVSPFSLPVMQLGFEKYIDLLYQGGELFERLMRINEEFCVEYANAQFDAGATAVCYYDPVSSPDNVPYDIYARTAREVAARVVPRMKGPMVLHTASARCMPLADDAVSNGFAMLTASSLDDISAMKRKCAGRITVLGNIDTVSVCNWSAAEAERKARDIIAAAGRGGGFILTDNHGEIPASAPFDTLVAISDAVHKWGVYPLDWIGGE